MDGMALDDMTLDTTALAGGEPLSPEQRAAGAGVLLLSACLPHPGVDRLRAATAEINAGPDTFLQNSLLCTHAIHYALYVHKTMINFLYMFLQLCAYILFKQIASFTYALSRALLHS